MSIIPSGVTRKQAIKIAQEFGGGGGAVSGDLPLIVNYNLFEASGALIDDLPIPWDTIYTN